MVLVRFTAALAVLFSVSGIGVAAGEKLVTYTRGAAEALAPTYVLSIAADGTGTFTDSQCKSQVRVEITTDEVARIREALAAAKPRALRATYLPRYADDDVGGARLTLVVGSRRISFDQPHAPKRLFAVATALDALVEAHHLMNAAAGGGTGCWCSTPNRGC